MASQQVALDAVLLKKLEKKRKGGGIIDCICILV